MPDEAKLVVELVDRSGAPGAASTTPPQPGAADIPGATLASDFQDTITQRGAGTVAGQGSAPAPEAPSIPATPPSAVPPPEAVRVPPASSPAPSVDPLLSTTRQILGVDPKTTQEELQAALGIPSERARSLLDAALGNQKAALPTAQPLPVPPTMAIPLEPAEPPKTDARRDLERFSDLITQQAMTPQERYQERTAMIQQALQEGLVSPEIAERSANREREVLAKALRDLEEASPEQKKTQNTVGSIVEGISKTAASAIGGPTAGAVSKVVSTAIPSIGELVATTPALAGFVAPAAAGLAATTAAVAVPIAMAAELRNEAVRAVQLSAQFSPDVQQALAEANVRQIVANIRTAQRLGDEAAGFVEARSRISTALQETRDILAEKPIRDFNLALTAAANTLEKINELMNRNPMLRDLLTMSPGDVGTWIGTRLREAFDFLGIDPNSISALFPGLKLLIGENKSKLNTPFSYFREQPHLEPPEEFGTASDRRPLNTEIGAIPGLRL